MDVHTLILESKWGESKFFLGEPKCLHDIFATLKALGFRPGCISESRGVARVYHSGSFIDVFELESRLILLNVVINYESGIIEEPEDFDVRLAELAGKYLDKSLGCFEHDKETSSVGGTASEETEKTEEQSRETSEEHPIYPTISEITCRHSAVQCCQEQAKTGGDPEYVPAHNTGDEMNDPINHKDVVRETELDLIGEMIDKIDWVESVVTCTICITIVTCGAVLGQYIIKLLELL